MVIALLLSTSTVEVKVERRQLSFQHFLKEQQDVMLVFNLSQNNSDGIKKVKALYGIGSEVLGNPLEIAENTLFRDSSI